MAAMLRPALRRRDAVACAALLGWVVMVYRDSFAVYFLAEDFTWLRLCRFGPGKGVWTLLTQDAIGGLYSWRPLLQLSFALNYAAWALYPLGYRLVAVAWHGLAVWVLYAIGLHVADRFRALIAATLFAAHPLLVESLSWTCAGGGLMSTALLLLATLGYLRWRRREGSAAWVVVPFALALATQESAVVLPLLLLSADVLLRGVPVPLRRRVGLYATLIAVTVAFLGWRWFTSPAAFDSTMVGLDPRWRMTAGGLALFLVGKLRLTTALLLTLGPSTTAAAIPLALGLTAAATWLWWRGSPAALWGVLWVGIAVGPYALLLLGPVARHMVLPLVGFALVFAELVAATYGVIARWNRSIAAMCVAVILVLWLGHMVRHIDLEQASFVKRGNLTRELLLDLLHVLPDPRAGSTLAFYRIGDLRVHENVFVYGLEDAVRLLYSDDTLHVEFPALGSGPVSAHHLLYHDGRLQVLNRGRN